MYANPNLSISDIGLSILNDSTGQKLEELLRKRRGVRNPSERLFASNNSSQRKSFPIELQEKSKETNDIPVEREVNNSDPIAQSKKTQDAEQKQKSILQAVNSISGVVTKRSRNLQKSVCLKEHRKSSAAVGFDPPTTSTPMQYKKNIDNTFSPLSLIEPMDTASMPTTQPPADIPQNENNPLVAAPNQTMTIKPTSPPESQPVTSEPSVHPALPTTNPTTRGKETCLNCNKSNKVLEEAIQRVPNDKENYEIQSTTQGRVSCPDDNKCSKPKKSFPKKRSIQKVDDKDQNELDKETGLTENIKDKTDKCIIFMPIIQNITSPQKVSNENAQSNAMPTPAPNAVIEKDAPEKQSNGNINENVDTECPKEGALLISSDESVGHDNKNEKQKTNTNQNLIITDDESREESYRTRNVPGKRAVAALYRHKALSLTKSSNNPSAERNPEHIRLNIAQESDSCALDLRLEDKRRASDENKRKSKLERLPAYMTVDSPPSSASSESVVYIPTDEPDIIHDDINASCQLPVILNNVKTINSTLAKTRAVIPAESEIKTNNEVLKESYLRSTKMLKPKKSKSNLLQNMRRKLYSCDLDNTNSNTSPTSLRRSQRNSSTSTLQDTSFSSKINENKVSNEGTKIQTTIVDHTFAIPNSVNKQVKKSLNKVRNQTVNVESNKECETSEQSTSHNSSSRNSTVFRKPYPVLKPCSVILRSPKILKTTLTCSTEKPKKSPPKASANKKKSKTQKEKPKQNYDSPIGNRRTQKSKSKNYNEDVLLMQFNPWGKDLEQYLLSKDERKRKNRKSRKGSKGNNRKRKESPSDNVDADSHKVMLCEPGLEEEPNVANEMESKEEVADKDKGKKNKTQKKIQNRKQKIQEKTVEENADSVQTNESSKKKKEGQKKRKQNPGNVNDQEAEREKLPSVDIPMPQETVEGDQIYVEEQNQYKEHVEHVELTAEQSTEPRISTETTPAANGKQQMEQMHNHKAEESQKERVEEKRAAKTRNRGKTRKANSNKLTAEELFDNLKRATDLENSRNLLLEKSIHETKELPRLRPRGQRKVAPLVKSTQANKNDKNSNAVTKKQQEIETCSTNERRPISLNTEGVTEGVTEEVCTEVDHSRQKTANSNIVVQNDISTEPSKQTSSKAKKRKIPIITEERVKKFASVNCTVDAESVDRSVLVERCSSRSVEVQEKQVAVREQTNSNSLFSWLSSLTDTSDSDKLNGTIAKIRGTPVGITLSSIQTLKFEEDNGVGYAFYGDDTHGVQQFGYIKFQPNSVKKRNKTKKFQLKFLCLLGELQVEVHESLITIYPGDFFTIEKGVYYRFENKNRDIAVLFCIKLP